MASFSGSKGYIKRFILRTPPNYAEAHIKRILPPDDVIREMRGWELRALKAKVEEIRRLAETEPIRLFEPTGPRQREFLEFSDRSVSVELLAAGNKFGKSTCGAIKLLEAVLGRAIWGKDRECVYPWMRRPINACCFADDFQSHRETTVPSILTWCPAGEIVGEKKNSAGQTTLLEFKNGSVIHFRSYDQRERKPEGKDWDFVWCDEPPPRDIFVPIMRGIVVRGGVMVITATLVREPWLADLANEGSGVRLFEGEIYDNKWLSRVTLENFASTLTDEEKEVRLYGRPSALVGRVFKEFVDGPPFVVPVRPRPYNAEVVAVVDPHERRPVHALWAWVEIGETTKVVVYDWALLEHPVERVIAEFRTRTGLVPFRYVIMDPNRGAAVQLGGVSWADVFMNAGYHVIFADDAVTMGHSLVRQAFMSGKLELLESCRGERGPIWQLERYVWDKPTPSGKERVKEGYKDFPDCLRYLVQSELGVSGVLGPQAIFYGGSGAKVEWGGFPVIEYL